MTNTYLKREVIITGVDFFFHRWQDFHLFLLSLQKMDADSIIVKPNSTHTSHKIRIGNLAVAVQKSAS